MTNTHTNIKFEFDNYLDEGEEIFWTGRPIQGLVFRKLDWFLIPLGLFWFTAVIVISVNIATTGAPYFFYFFLAIFWVFGFFFTIGRFLIDIRRRKNTFYAVSNQRIIIKSGTRSTKIKSHNIHKLPKLERIENPDGTGSLVFTESQFLVNSSIDMNILGVDISATQFERIENVKEVYQIIENLTKD